MRDLLVALPIEIVVNILNFLPAEDLLSFATVSTAWRDVVLSDQSDEVLWRHRAREEFAAQPPCAEPGARHPTWKSVCEDL
jgi:hypothetical protein